MALSKLSGDEQGIIFSQLCNVLDPGVAVAFGSASNELRALTQAQRLQLRADYEVAAALCPLVLGMRSCKELREAKKLARIVSYLSGADDLATLGSLGSVLPALEALQLYKCAGAADPDGVQRLMAGLGTGALPAFTSLSIYSMHMGDAGASALAAALGRGALPRLKELLLSNAAIGDAGLAALAPALRRLPALENLDLNGNPFGDKGLAALVAPPPPPPAGVLTKLKTLYLEGTQVSDAGCAALSSALNSGALPVLGHLYLIGIPASGAAMAAVHEARGSLTCYVAA